MDLFTGKLILAPLAGISDRVFRGICREHGAECVVSEMVSAEGLLHNSKNTEALLRFNESERPLGIQLFGADPERLAEAARCVADMVHPDFIDLNAGCPVPKVVRRNGGSALLKDADLFGRIVSAMVRAVRIPVTVKLRSGWTHQSLVDTQFAQIAQDCGAAAVALHPRTRSMGFSGHSYWERITEVRKVLEIPLIGNGDITTPDDARRMLRQTGCDAIMIGRGARGNPWLFENTRRLLQGGEPEAVTRAMRHRVLRLHVERYRAAYGSERTVRELKQHVPWYVKGMPGAAQFRAQVFSCTTIQALEDCIERYFPASEDTSSRMHSASNNQYRRAADSP
jgi:nifR3 family TIM-barrel protein